MARPTVYSNEEIDYFAEIAFGAEYGRQSGRIVKWVKNPRIKVVGEPTESDLAAVQTVIDELNELIDGIALERVDSDPNIIMHYAPLADFRTIEPNYQMADGHFNVGYFWLSARGGRIMRARILVATDVGSIRRAHIAREELTQVLGLPKDSKRYRDSIFYQELSIVTEYSDMDRVLIQMLYRPEVAPNMDVEQARRVLAAVDR